MINVWCGVALIKVVLVVFIVLIQKYYEFDGYIYPIITGIVCGIVLLIYGIMNNEFKNLNKNNLGILILCGVFLSYFIISTYYLLNNCQHPGYYKILAIYELIIILIISYFYFNAKITKFNLIGFTLIIIGTFFIIM